jgi:pyrroloquinoline quinone biosynthesis protein B
MKRREFLEACLGKTLGFYCLLLPEGTRFGKKPGTDNQNTSSPVLIKVLGTAQDGGIPHAGCYCPHCQQARSNSQLARMISSLAILDLTERQFFLIDATPDIRQQSAMACQRLGLDSSGTKVPPSGILLTHAHIGHYTGLMFFGYEAMSTQRLPVYCSQSMARFLRDNGPWSQLVTLENISIHSFEMDRENWLNPRISVIPFRVPHREEYSDTLGFQIIGPHNKLLYIPDIQKWHVWDRSIREEVKKVDYALLDGTFFSPDELPGRDFAKIGHPFIQDSLRILEKVVEEGNSQVYFTHLNHSNLALNPEGTARKQIEKMGFGLAEDGMELRL